MIIGSEITNEKQDFIDIRPEKWMKQRIFQLILNMEMNTSFLSAMNIIGFILKCFQLWMPCFMLENTIFWDRNDYITRIMIFISKCQSGLSVDLISDKFQQILIVFCIISLVFYLYLCYESVHFYNNAYISKKFSYVFIIFTSILVNIFIPMVSMSIMSMLFCGKWKQTWYLLVISSFFLVMNMVFEISIVNNRIFFVPNLLCATNQYLKFVLDLVIVFFSSISIIQKNTTDHNILIIINLIVILLYLVLMCIFVKNGSIIYQKQRRFVSLVTISGLTISCIMFYFIFFRKILTSMILSIIFGICYLSLLITDWIERKNETETVEFLDSFQDFTNDTKSISENRIIKYCHFGFQNGHPSIFNWTLFEEITNVLSHKLPIMMLISRIIAVYPEETRRLEYMSKQIQIIRSKSILRKFFLLQIQYLVESRDPKLTTHIRASLFELSKRVDRAKRRIRTVFDLILQQSYKDVDAWIKRAFEDTKRVDIGYKRILSRYSNNRFVARSYARFLREVLADDKEHYQWQIRIKMLNDGLTVAPDLTHEFGVRCFPYIPQSLYSRNLRELSDSVVTDTDFENMEDSSIHQVDEMKHVMKKMISNLSIPSIVFSKVLNIMLFLTMIVSPPLIVIMISKYYQTDMDTISNSIHSLSIIRNLIMQYASFGLRLIGESIVVDNTSSQRLIPAHYYSSFLYDSFNNKTNTREQARELFSLFTESLQGINKIRNFKIGNKYIDQARKLCFENMVNGTVFLNSNTSVIVKSSILSLYMRTTTYMVMFTNDDTELSGMSGVLAILNITRDIPNMADALNKAMASLIEYIKWNNIQYQNYIEALKKFGVIIMIVLCIFVIWYEMRIISRDKTTILKCLMQIPKSTISTAAESLSIISEQSDKKSKKSSDSDLNKQEENIIRIFSSSSDHLFVYDDQVLFLVCTILCSILCISIFVLLLSLLQEERDLFAKNIPHLNYVLGISGYLNWGLASMINLVLSINGYQQSHKSIPWLINAVESKFVMMRSFYNIARYGGKDGEKPLLAISDESRTITLPFMCNETMNDAIACLNLEQGFLLIDSMVEKLVHPLRYNASKFNSSVDTIGELWGLGSLVLYDRFFYPLHKNIIPLIEKIINENFSRKWAVIISICIICGICTIQALIQSNKTQKNLQYALSFVLHCSLDGVFQSTQVFSILSGDFAIPIHNSGSRSIEFLDEVVLNMTDCIFLLDSNGSILYQNRTAERYFHLHEKSDIKSIFLNNKEDLDSIRNGSSSMQMIVKFILNDGDKTSFSINNLKFGGNTILIARDESAKFKHNQLIEDERMKSEKLLSAILPPILVNRVHKGEKNISFSVQSSTIIFIDIVNFTPWCSKNTSEKVVLILNHIFKEFDSILLCCPSLTKIKCIGDCYMAAGGIFSEINNPSEHSKEAIEFCLRAISVINSINDFYGESLQIRCGIHTGGPVIAGVMGIEKPTFEILGKPISFAQQMEHHGSPMLIHISRSVYELVYDGNFNIRERGRIEIKGEQFFTYFVVPNNKC